MAVPYTFGSATTSIPLSQLDSNFATTITLGNTAVQLGNTITSLTGVSNVASATSLTLGSNGNTTAVTIDTAQNVGIGVTPSAWASSRTKIQFSSAGTVAGFVGCYDGSGANNAMGFGSNCYLSGSGWVYNNSSSASYFSATNGTFQWNTAASGTAGNAITFTQSLALGKGTTLALEGATSASGTGIAFPATQSASSNANTLDDYEEGTWTATDISGAGLSFTNTTQTYTKIGRVVTLCIDNLAWPVTASASAAEVGGLPFTASSAGGGGGICNYAVSTIGLVVLNNASSLRLYNLPSAYTRTSNANMSNNSLYFSLTYITST